MAQTSMGRGPTACALQPQIARWLLVTIAVLLAAMPARAEPELSLSWSAPHACPDATWARRRIESQLLRDSSAEVAEGVHASVQIAQSSGGFALTLHTTSEGSVGQRTIEGRACDELAEAAALIIALSVSERDARLSAEKQAPKPSSAAPPRAPQERAHVRLFALRADALLDVGFLDPLGYGPALALGYQHDMWRAELAALWLVPRVVRGEDPNAGSVKASLWAVRGGVCTLFGGWRIQGGPCGGVELGQARGRGGSELTAREDAYAWIAAFAGMRVSVGLIAKLSLVAQADLVASVLRPRFVTERAASYQRIHEPWPAQLRANAGLELLF